MPYPASTRLTSSGAVMALALLSCEPANQLAPGPPMPTAPEVPAGAAYDPCAELDCAPKLDERAFTSTPGAGLVVQRMPVQKASNEPALGGVLNDIEAHLPASYGRQYRDADRVTHGHETSHGIHAHLRNNFNNTGQRANAFYLLEDRFALVVEPPIRKSQVGPFVPASLRGSRFGTYISGQAAWDDRPLYVWDEWNAYVNGSAVAVDLFRAGRWTFGSRDAVAGTLEFTIYALAVGAAVERHAPAYFEQNLQFREFLAAQTLRAMELYRAGAAMAPFARADQEALARRLEESPEAEPIRAFAFRVFGEAWARWALFGDPLPDADEVPDEPPPSGGEVPPDEVPDEPPTPDDLPDEPDETPPDDVPDGPTPPDEVPDEPAPEDGEPPPIEVPDQPQPDGDLPDLPGEDSDGDGIADDADLCSETPPRARVWTEGAWLGCAVGQRRDADTPPLVVDADADGVPDSVDTCLGTARGARVWANGPWRGCAGGQQANNAGNIEADADRDGVADSDDLCAGTPNGAVVWREGPWRGCAGGQRRG